MLLSASVPPDLGADTTDNYLMACTRILKVLSNAPGRTDWQYHVESISLSLISMVSVLMGVNNHMTLAALLNMLAVLIYSLPDFGSFILSHSSDTQTTNCHLLVYLCRLILEQGHPETRNKALLTEIVTLLEALSFTAKSELAPRLVCLLNDEKVVVNLLSGDYSPRILCRIINLLVILASHSQFCQSLLFTTNVDTPEERNNDTVAIPIIQQLCFWLIDTGRRNNNDTEINTSILTFFALLSLSQPDVHFHLVTSTIVIPSLIVFISQLTTAFWEDDEELLSATTPEVSLRICTLNQTLFLLHHLIFTSVSFLNLRQKLYVPQHRIFHGLLHVFVVTFGRLSYGEAPEWIDRQGRIDLISLTDMARDILDHIIDGPEADRTWLTFQIEGDKGDDTDEEAMEVQLIG